MPHSARSLVLHLLPSFFVLILGAYGLWVATDGAAAFTDEAARRHRVEAHSPLIPTFYLEDMHGNEVVLERGQTPTVVEFIYTTCPTMCQSAGAPYARLRDRFVANGTDKFVRLLSISFDPLNDDLPALQYYAERHRADGRSWNVARMAQDDFDAFSSAFGLRVIRNEWGGYEHNVAMLILDNQNRLVRVLDYESVDAAFDFISGMIDAES